MGEKVMSGLKIYILNFRYTIIPGTNPIKKRERASLTDRKNENIKYFISFSGNRTHNWATTGPGAGLISTIAKKRELSLIINYSTFSITCTRITH